MTEQERYDLMIDEIYNLKEENKKLKLWLEKADNLLEDVIYYANNDLIKNAENIRYEISRLI